MADQKITELTELTDPESTDVLPIVDISETTTKKITFGNLIPWIELTVIGNQQLEQDINILINSAAIASTLNPYDDMYLDIFKDSNGYSNTVDLGNTTAYFSSNYYINLTPSQGSINLNYGNSGQDTSTSFILRAILNINPDAKIYNVTWTPYKTGGEVQSYAKYFYSDLTSYQGTTKTGDTPTSETNPNPLKLVTYIEMWSRLSSSSGYNTGCNSCIAYNLTETYSDKLVQTIAQTITANPIAHMVYCHKTISGAGSVTYNISFDGGSTWVTNQTLETYNTSVHVGSSMKIKLNLNGTGDAVLSKDYAVMLYY
jgi:hypothetical protein